MNISFAQYDALKLVEKFAPYYRNCGFLYILQHPAWGEYLKFGITSTSLARRLSHYTGSLSSPPLVLDVFFVTHKRLLEDRLIEIFHSETKENHREYVKTSLVTLQQTIDRLISKDDHLSEKFPVPIYHYRPRVDEIGSIDNHPKEIQLSDDCYLLKEEKTDGHDASESGFVSFSPQFKQRCQIKHKEQEVPTLGASETTETTETTITKARRPMVSPELRGIRFYSPPDSWCACAQTKYERRIKSFGFLRCGGAQAALMQAIEWRKNKIVEMQQNYVKQVVVTEQTEITTRRRGVRYDAQRDCMWGFVQFRRETQRKSFSCKKFGTKAQAAEAAHQWRTEILAELHREGRWNKKKSKEKVRGSQAQKVESSSYKPHKRRFYSACRYQQELQSKNASLLPLLPLSQNTLANGSAPANPKERGSMERPT